MGLQPISAKGKGATSLNRKRSKFAGFWNNSRKFAVQTPAVIVPIVPLFIPLGSFDLFATVVYAFVSCLRRCTGTIFRPGLNETAISLITFQLDNLDLRHISIH